MHYAVTLWLPHRSPPMPKPTRNAFHLRGAITAILQADTTIQGQTVPYMTISERFFGPLLNGANWSLKHAAPATPEMAAALDKATRQVQAAFNV